MTGSWQPLALAALSAAAPLAAQTPRTGTAVIIGSATSAETGATLGYSVVSVAAAAREEFTNDHGAFVLRGLPAGPLTLRVKHIGFTPRDTVLVLRDDDTVRIQIALKRLIVTLPAMRITGTCGGQRADERNGAILAALFDQLLQSAERYRLLAASHPFEMVVQRTRGIRQDRGYRSPIVDTIVQSGLSDQHYEPGRVIRDGGMPGPSGQPATLVLVPELVDFADTAFINNHCFSYAGSLKLDTVPVLMIDFQPAPSLGNALDIRGTMFLAASGYRLVFAKMELTRGRMIVETTFKDIVPGILIIDRLESTTTQVGVARGESGRVLEVRWKKGPP